MRPVDGDGHNGTVPLDQAMLVVIHGARPVPLALATACGRRRGDRWNWHNVSGEMR
jgi:hypothetical protein